MSAAAAAADVFLISGGLRVVLVMRTRGLYYVKSYYDR
jgi:hypothetical protein